MTPYNFPHFIPVSNLLSSDEIIQPHKIVVFVYTKIFLPAHLLCQPIQYSAQTQLIVCGVIIIVDVDVGIVFSLLPSSVPVGKFSQGQPN